MRRLQSSFRYFLRSCEYTEGAPQSEEQGATIWISFSIFLKEMNTRSWTCSLFLVPCSFQRSTNRTNQRTRRREQRPPASDFLSTAGYNLNCASATKFPSTSQGPVRCHPQDPANKVALHNSKKIVGFEFWLTSDHSNASHIRAKEFPGVWGISGLVVLNADSHPSNKLHQTDWKNRRVGSFDIDEQGWALFREPSWGQFFPDQAPDECSVSKERFCRERTWKSRGVRLLNISNAGVCSMFYPH